MAIALHTFLLQLILFFFASMAETNNPRKIYLVQMKVAGHRYGSSSGHQELLGEVLDDDSTVANALIYSYRESFTGFSARLTQNERQKLKRRREVLEVSRSRNLKPHTTRSWDFMNLTLAAKRNTKAESELVVAVIDSGIWPYSELFRSDSPPPPAWQNKCQNITCNNKIVGARSYYLEKENYNLTEENSVIDVMGHGTHIASIVAGREIEKASYFGLAEGTMRGGVPNAKIAVYKTCWRIRNKKGEEVFVCPQHKALKAIEDAIKDEVDVISYSQGLDYPVPMHKDCVSWAFLRAVEKGILISASAGNFGPNYYAVANGAPWVMTVAASLKDRFFETKLELEGEDKPVTVYNTINTFETQDSFYPLLLETESTRKRELIADRSKDDLVASNYKNDEGKDVFFDISQITILNKAIQERAKGVIAVGGFSNYNESEKLQFPIASIFLDDKMGIDLWDYYENKRNHSVKIHKTVEIPREEGWDPTIADLSSRGPNCDNLLANILKPDIAAPGLDIVAGWPENVNLLQVPANDYRHLRFNILSGTSMACPHATGLALYVKSFKPSWSPSAIKSALMTTSTEMLGLGNDFAYGSGQLNATKVLDPGLIYETKHQDYIDYMCKQGYNTEELRSHVGSHTIDCSGTKIDQNADLNYPTMAARVKLNTEFSKVFYRTVTNVGDRNSTYLGEIKFRGEKSLGANITVNPKRLHFSELGETKTFTVNVTGKAEPNSKYSKESFMIGNTWLTWTEINGSRQVRSPIVIYSINIDKESRACRKFHKK
uniref:Cucumisin n=1 Tax=Noccaea caerulescens TaxID=107243 RepID=A0A1J3CU78_NOCCA